MDDKTVDLQTLVQGLRRNFDYLDQEVSKLEKEAETIRVRAEARDAARGRIAASEQEVEALKAQRSELLGRWQEAEFEDSLTDKQEIKRRWVEIDARVKELEEDIRGERDSLEPPDRQHAARVAVSRDTLKKVNVSDFIKRLTAILQDQAKEINTRIGRIHVPESVYDKAEYDRQRSRVDVSYSYTLSREKRLTEKEAEKRAKMRPVSSTDEMHAIQSERNRKPQQRKPLTLADANGEQQESAPPKYEPSGVLTYAAIREALKEKQSA